MAEVCWRPVSVDVGWGTLRGKTCTVGRRERAAVRLVGIHGWLDNANSFDTLVPLLPEGVEVLLLDIPGHGLSDHLPLGAHYNPFVYAMNVRSAVMGLGWSRFILMGHSMGAAVTNYFTALFPEFVEALINIDFLLPYQASVVELTRTYALDHAKYEQFEPGSGVVYSEKEALNRMVVARVIGNDTEPNVDHEAAQLLLPRSVRQVKGGYVWSYDPKARTDFMRLFGGQNWIATLSEIHCPVLAVRATRGVCRLDERLYRKVLETYGKHAAWFTYEVVEGAHHVHLTHPHRVAPLIKSFLKQLHNTHAKL